MIEEIDLGIESLNKYNMIPIDPKFNLTINEQRLINSLNLTHLGSQKSLLKYIGTMHDLIHEFESHDISPLHIEKFMNQYVKKLEYSNQFLDTKIKQMVLDIKYYSILRRI